MIVLERISDDIREMKDTIKENSKIFYETTLEQNERIAVLETLAKNNQKEIDDNKKDADRRFGVVWRIGGGAVVIAFGILCALLQAGII